MAGLRNVYVAFCFIATGGLLFGYIIGITGNVVTSGQLLCPDHWTGDVGSLTSYGYHQCYQLDALEKGFLSSLNLIGACISSLFCFRYADLLGRKLEVQIAGVLYFTGSLIAAASPMLWGILIGLTIYGLGIGFAMHAAPVYIAEISPAEVRGFLVSAKELVIVVGIFAGFFFGFIFSGMDTVGWRFMVLLSTAFALVQALGASYIPQSPRYLVLQACRLGGGRFLSDDASASALVDEAKKALQFFRRASAEEVEGEMMTLIAEISAAVGSTQAKWSDAFRYRRPLTIGCGLVFLQQVTGQPSVLYFATNIFKSAGFGDQAALSSVWVGLIKLVATMVCVWRVDQYGRRKLLFIGISMMVAALALIATAFIFRECTAPAVSLQDCDASDVSLPPGWAVATVVGLMVYVSGYQVGFGPISWVMISEVFPLQVRGAAMSIAAVVNFGSNILMTLLQEVLQRAFTPAGVFFGYFMLALLSIAFVAGVVPETKGKTLEEIERMLAGGGKSDVVVEPAMQQAAECSKAA